MIPGYDEWLTPPEDDERPTKEELIELGVIGDDKKNELIEMATNYRGNQP
ncbi:hypothetical protein RYX41_17180 [Lactiplantibacillus plantarum]|nr:hypothetical protein [Lactiplantibacillus plantarum]